MKKLSIFLISFFLIFSITSKTLALEVGGGGGTAVEIKDEGIQITPSATSINFKGRNVTASPSGTNVNVDISTSTTQLRVVLTTTQLNISSATWVKVLFSSKSIDNLNEYSTTTYRFTAKNSGVYSVYAQVDFYQWTVSDRYITSVYKNGVINGSTEFPSPSVATVGFLSIPVFVLVSLSAGDYIEVYVYTVDGTGVDVEYSSTNDRSYMTIFRIGD